MPEHIYDIEQLGESCYFIITTKYARDFMYHTCENTKLLEEIMTDFNPLRTDYYPEE